MRCFFFGSLTFDGLKGKKETDVMVLGSEVVLYAIGGGTTTRLNGVTCSSCPSTTATGASQDTEDGTGGAAVIANCRES